MNDLPRSGFRAVSGPSAVSPSYLVATPDLVCTGHDRASVLPHGQYAWFDRPADGSIELTRDPLGIEKLFYVYRDDGSVEVSSRFTDLLRLPGRIYSAPRGAHVRISADGSRTVVRRCVSGRIADPLDPDAFRRIAVERLEQVFRLIRSLEDEDHPVFVALSGGLDSSAVAWFAQQALRRPVACTLDLGGSEDARKSERLSCLIGIEHRIFSTSREEILDALRLAPAICQDYRDFNVHCAVINLILAQKIRDLVDRDVPGAEWPIVLTGDLMNEFTNDYAEETIEGKVYYRLPRVGGRMLQRHLIGGLDTSDREISPFAYHGLTCIQPYAHLYDLYLALDENVLTGANAKRRLNDFLVPPDLLEHLPESKLRAQVGDRESMGVLGLCHREGIDERYFLERLLAGSGALRDRIPIVMGRYDVESFDPVGSVN